MEELDGFLLSNPTQQPQGSPSLKLSIAELGHRLDSVAGRKRSRRHRGILPWALLGAALVVAEVIVPLLLLRGG